MRRYIDILVAIIVGMVCIYPYIFAYWGVDSYSNYKLHYFYQDSELVYLSRIHEVTEGHVNVSSPVFSEYKEVKNIQQPFGEWLYAILSLGNPELVPFVAMVTKFIFPALLFILVFRVVLRLINGLSTERHVNEWVALVISTFVVLGYDFINLPFIKQTLTGTFSEPVLSLWTRIVYPITGALTLFAIFYLVLTLHLRHKAIRVIVAGLLLGFSSGYIFSYALGLVFVGITLVLALFERDWFRAKNVFAIILIGLLTNFTYILSIFTVSGDTTVLQKNGLLLTHQILHNKVLYIATIVFALLSISQYSFNHRDNPLWKNRSWQVLATILLSSFVVLNQQIITGKTVWPGHFVQYTNPICFIVFFLSAFTLSDSLVKKMSMSLRHLFHRGVVIACILSTAFIFLVNLFTVQSVFSNYDLYQDTQRYALALDWLNRNSNQECTVFPVEERERIEKYITAYTHCDIYQSSYVFYAVPDERILHNYIVQLRLLGVKEDELEIYLDAHEDDIRKYFFTDWADKFSDGNDQWVFNTRTPESMAAFQPNAKTKVIKEYRKLADEATDSLLRRYAIHYIVVDRKYTTPDLTHLDYPVVFESKEIVILEVK